MTAPITRTLIAAHIAGAFAESGAASTAAIIARAQETNCGDKVLRTLHSLPDRRYATMRELWIALSHLPVE